jgi:flagellar protein FlaG
VHEETGFEMLQIIDSRTDVVIREMPPHEILDMIARMWEAIGVFVDKTA